MYVSNHRLRILGTAFALCGLLVVGIALVGYGSDSGDEAAASAGLTYPIVDTNQGLCYGNAGQIEPPAAGDAFYGQDAQYTGNVPSYTDNGDGTITDNVTGLVWTQEISSYAMPWSDAAGYCESLETGGYTDWRLPTVKELWSIRDYSQGWPWVDTDYFYLVGDGSELAQHHSWTSDLYLVESEYQNEQVQGDPAWIVNDWTGHIKAMSGSRFVRAVRGTTSYGINDFVDNGDGTVTDQFTGLMWSQEDNGEALSWEEALAYAESATLAGYEDWRLPNIKELQSIADYSVTEIPAMDTSVFNLTAVTNVIYDLDTGEQIDTQVNYPFYWSSTSNPVEGEGEDIDGGTIFAWFLASGYNTFPDGYDLHGAGSVCFGAKSDEDAGLENSVELMVRLVRGGDVIETPEGNPDCIDEDRVVEFPEGDTGRPGGSGDSQEEGGDARPDTAAAAAQLGVSEEALIAALGDPSQGAPDFAAAAEALGVAEDVLMSALGGSPEDGGMPPAEMVDDIGTPQESTSTADGTGTDPSDEDNVPQGLDLAAAAAWLGVTEEALIAEISAAAAELGVTEKALLDALTMPTDSMDVQPGPADTTDTVDDTASTGLAYPIVDTNQAVCYDDSGVIACPSEGEAFYGQDAQYTGNVPSYTDNGDGTITDNVTGLIWHKSPDTDGDGDIDAADKMSYEDACAYCESLSYAGHDDWQLPTIKQLYSLMDFSGVDPSGYEGTDTSGLIPFIDIDYFDFAYGDTEAGERIIDSQYASSNLYGGGAYEDLLFGVNFADGRIKGYGLTLFGRDKTFFVLCVRGNTDYGLNDLSDNGDGTITDVATGLMWAQDDSGSDAPDGLTWEEALVYVEVQNDTEYLGYNDWRLPNVKELQSIVDYSRSPDATGSAAIDPLFDATSVVNESGETDYAFYWSSTTHANWTESPGSAGAYVSFGRAMGYMDGAWSDVHGAGAQRSDPKSGDPSEWPTGNGPQGDAIRIYNHVRLVRDAESEAASSDRAETIPSESPETSTADWASDLSYSIVDTGQSDCYNSNGETIAPPAAGEAFYGQDAQTDGGPFAYQNNGDGTVTDLTTGLMWQVTPSSRSFSYEEALEYAENLELAGYDDWRLPSTKELFSISDFSEGWPYLDTSVFDLAGDSVSKDEQYWTEYYVGLTHGGAVSAFGVNHGTGHIKSYPAQASGPMGNYVRVVRGETYGVNTFVDNGDATVTDMATGLMWSQDDSGVGMAWEDALAYAEGSTLAGYDDWRLPNVKELQSIVDYSASPNAIDADDLGPAIDTDVFNITPLPSGTTAYDPDYGYFWTSTSAYFNAQSPGYYYAWYVAFGTAVDDSGEDSHGAGGVRFDTKVEGGPAGEGGERVFNYVRLVRDAE